MGEYADGRVKHIICLAVVALIIALNAVLIMLTLMGKA